MSEQPPPPPQQPQPQQLPKAPAAVPVTGDTEASTLTDERYDQLQRLVMYADPLHMGRYNVCLIAQYSLLAVVAAALSTLPTWLIRALAFLGIIVSVLWFFTACSLSGKIDWLNGELTDFQNSVHAEYLNSTNGRWFTRFSTTVIMTWILPGLFVVVWVIVLFFKDSPPSPS